MAGLVDGDPSAFVGVVAHVLGNPDLGDQLRRQHIAGRHRRAPVSERDDQGLVEQLLDPDRGVARAEIGDQLCVDAVLVVLAVEVVLRDLEAIRLRRQGEADRSIESSGSQQRSVEVGRPVRGGDDEDVGHR